MTPVGEPAGERRILLLAPTHKDLETARAVFESAGVRCRCCRYLDELCDQLELGAGVVILPEEAISQDRQGSLTAWLAKQPPWSDLPILVLARPGADSAAVAQAMELLGNVTVLERPIRVAALISAVRTALRARQRQYQIREHLQERARNKAALRESDRRKDEFLALLAHELRNPLVPIRNSLEILRLGHRSEADVVHSVEMMDRQVDHLVRLVDDLLDIARITRGKIELRKEPINVADVVAHAVETSRPLIEAGRYELTVEVPSEDLMVEGDPVRLAQVIANLLNNAAKYSNPGGRIDLKVCRQDNSASISVRDSGIGIERKMLSPIFDLFTQSDQSREHAQGGLGIGLTLAKNLVELHGGAIQAFSEGTGKGSEFVVRLPLSAQPPVADTSSTHTAPASELPPRRVLVVDDDHGVAESLEMLLKLLNVEVQVVHDGQAALEALKTYHPDIVLLDLGMRGMDGYEVARRIRAQAEFHDVTLVALTGWGRDEDRRRSHDAGFDSHVTKPANMATLRKLLLAANGRPRCQDQPKS